MEIEEFIEQDVLVFLDDKMDKPRSGLAVRQRAPIKSTIVTRDYEYEFFMALDHKDLGGAKRVLHDLKEKFDECPSNAPEKMQLKSLLLDLYEKFKDHLDAQNTFTKINLQLGGGDITPAITISESVQQPPPSETIPITTTSLPPTTSLPIAPTQQPLGKETPSAPTTPPSVTPIPLETAQETSAPRAETASSAPMAILPMTPAAPAQIVSERTVTQAAPIPLPAPPARIADELPRLPPEHAELDVKKDSANSAYEQPIQQSMSRSTTPAATMLAPTIEDTLNKRLDTINDQLRNGNWNAAVIAYRDVKQQISQQSNVITDKTVKRCMTLYELLRSQKPAQPKRHTITPVLKNDTTITRNAAQTVAKTTKPLTLDEDGDADRHIMMMLEACKQELDRDLQANNLAGAMKCYRDMKMLAQQVRSPSRAATVAAKLQVIHTVIKKMQEHTTSSERTLIGAQP